MPTAAPPASSRSPGRPQASRPGSARPGAARHRPPPSRRRRPACGRPAELPKSWAISVSRPAGPPRAGGVGQQACHSRSSAAGCHLVHAGVDQWSPQLMAAHSPHPSASSAHHPDKERGSRSGACPAAVPDLGVRKGIIHPHQLQLPAHASLARGPPIPSPLDPSLVGSSLRPGWRNRQTAAASKAVVRKERATSSTLGSTRVPSVMAAHSPQPSCSVVTTRTKRRERFRWVPAAVPSSARNGISTRTSSTPVSLTARGLPSPHRRWRLVGSTLRPGWRNRQTRRPQKPLFERTCGFKSRSGHALFEMFLQVRRLHLGVKLHEVPCRVTSRSQLITSGLSERETRRGASGGLCPMRP